MKGFMKTVLIAGMMVLAAGLAFAAERVDQVSYLRTEHAGGDAPAQVGGGDAQLDQRRGDFLRFAQGKIREMNRNHIYARPRMRISKEADGSYRAVYHQINETSLACEVNRSKSKSIPFVAVLSYQEEVYATSCATPEQCRQGEFSPVGMIPNRHIFSYRNGTWN